MRWLLTLSIICIYSSSASAEATSCEFQRRPARDFYFRQLPAAIVGWVKCQPYRTGANAVFVAVVPSENRAGLLALVSEYDRVVVTDRQMSRVREEKPNGWLELESRRPAGFTRHVAFRAVSLDKTRLVFLSTLPSASTAEALTRLKALQRYFKNKDHAQAIVNALDP